jgi:photosystem II stability/assembly factor-like uncharacterized protein
MASDITLRGLSRVFLIENRAGPENVPLFLELAAAGAVSKPFGSVTRVEGPSLTRRKGYRALTSYSSGQENASLPITLRHTLALSTMLRIGRLGCELDAQVHFGACTDPRNFSEGWHDGKIQIFESASLTDYNTTEEGSLTSGDEGEVNEDVELSALEFYEKLPLTFSERAQSEVAQEIISVVVCDSVGCGDCDTPSDGCQKIYAVSAPAGSSPGVLPEVLVSDDGLSAIDNESPITTLAIGEDPDDAACVGNNLVVVSEDSISLHWADLSDLIDGTETWAEVTTGFNAGGAPRAIFSASPFDTWIVGVGGYVYFTTDPTNSVTVQDAGSTTSNQLNDVYAFDLENVVAVGESNTVINTVNGGDTWQSITGPDAGVGLTAVTMRTEKEWWVGTDDGKLWYTRDSGANWTEKTFPGSGSGQIYDIEWASDTVGYMAHGTGTAGRLLSTISGGYQWSVLPDGNSSLPENDNINSIAVCELEVNVLYAGGLGADAADGILLKGTAS